MNILIKSAKIVDPRSDYNGKKLDILIEDGVIKEIGNSLTSDNSDVIAFEGMHVSPGWIDLRSQFCDPGHEYKEDLASGLKAAAKGGFAGVCVLPSTNPPVDSKSGIEYIVQKSKPAVPKVFPLGTVSVHRDGKELSEMYDMKQAGAVAFTDDKQALKHAGLLQRALLYTKAFDGLVMDFPHNSDVAEDGIVHEGPVSTGLGIKGIPGLAEEIAVTRDLYVAEYCDARIHIGPITSAKSVALIKEAKKKGLKVTCDTTSMHLYYTDESLQNFDTNFKLTPPLREESDRKALLEGVKDGTIDCISSDHTPQDIEEKKCEFENAGYGAINLQTSFGLALSSGVELPELVNSFSIHPGNIIGNEPPVIEKNASAFLTLFNPYEKSTIEAADIASKSLNSTAIGKELQGKVYGIVVGDQVAQNE